MAKLPLNAKLSAELLWTAVQANETSLFSASPNNVSNTTKTVFCRSDVNFVAGSTFNWLSVVGNDDRIAFTLPARSLVESALLVVNTASTNGAGLTTSTISVGTTTGGAELLDATALQAAGAGSTLGNTLTEEGTSLPTTVQGLYLHTGGNVTVRIANAGGAVGVTAGSFSVYVFFKQLPLWKFVTVYSHLLNSKRQITTTLRSGICFVTQ